MKYRSENIIIDQKRRIQEPYKGKGYKEWKCTNPSKEYLESNTYSPNDTKRCRDLPGLSEVDVSTKPIDAAITCIIVTERLPFTKRCHQPPRLFSPLCRVPAQRGTARCRGIEHRTPKVHGPSTVSQVPLLAAWGIGGRCPHVLHVARRLLSESVHIGVHDVHKQRLRRCIVYVFGKRLRQPPIQHGKDCVLWSSLDHETFGRYQGPGHVRPRSIVHGPVRKWSGRGSIVNAGSLCFFGLATVAHKFAAIVRLAQYLWMGSLVMILAIEWLARVPFPRTCWHGQFSLALTVHRIAFLFGGHVTAFCLYTDLVFRDTSCSR